MPIPPLRVFIILPLLPTAYPTFALTIKISFRYKLVSPVSWVSHDKPPLVVLRTVPTGAAPYKVKELTTEIELKPGVVPGTLATNQFVPPLVVLYTSSFKPSVLKYPLLASAKTILEM